MFCNAMQTLSYCSSMAHGRALGEIYIQYIMVCNVHCDHPICSVRSQTDVVMSLCSYCRGLVLCSLLIVPIHWYIGVGGWGGGWQTLQTLVDPPITCCACTSSPWGGSIDVCKRAHTATWDGRRDTPVTSRPISLTGGGEKKYYYYFFFQNGGDSICVKITHLHTNLFFLFFICGVRRSLSEGALMQSIACEGAVS